MLSRTMAQCSIWHQVKNYLMTNQTVPFHRQVDRSIGVLRFGIDTVRGGLMDTRSIGQIISSSESSESTARLRERGLSVTP
jgi:hypothetical protein